MKRRECAVEDTRRPRAIKVNGGAAAREMHDGNNCPGLEGGRDLWRQESCGEGAIDHDGLDPNALGCHCSSEVAGPILACEMEYFITSMTAAADQLRQRLVVAIGGGDVGEAHGAGGLGGAAAHRQHR